MRRHCIAVVAVVCLAAGGCASDPQLNHVAARADAADCVALGSQIGLNLNVQESNQFLLLSSMDPASAASTAAFLDQVSQRFYDSFTRAGFTPRPTGDKLVCLCVDNYSELDTYGRLADGAEVSWMDAFYSHRTNRVAVVRNAGAAAQRPASTGKLGQLAARPLPITASPRPVAPSSASLNLRTVTHELAHQLAFNSGLQRRGATYPFWLTEGLATNFEADFTGYFGLDQGETCHRCRLIEAKAGGRLIPMDQFVGMVDLPAGLSAQGTREAYAQAWGLFHFLLKRHPAELQQFMADLTSPWAGTQNCESIRSKFIATFGSIHSLNRDFTPFIDGK